MKELSRHDLIHRWLSSQEEFMQQIDDTGGWPVGYTHVSFYHDGPCGNRYCKFTNRSLRTGWWTTVATADDYYYWKLSDEKKKEFVTKAKQQLISELRSISV